MTRCPFRAIMRVLVMRIVHVQMLVMKRLVGVKELPAVLSWPSQHAKHRCRQR